MLKIGITGGIGSGKTTVCRVFAVLGVPVYDADTAAKHLMQTDAVLIANLKAAFGERTYAGTQLDRKYLAAIVFNDPDKLKKLNAIVHPTVFGDFETWCSRQNAAYVIKETALLFESGSYRLCDENVLVTAPLELRIRRIAARDGWNRQDIQKRIDKQNSEEQNITLADHVIVNDEARLLVPQVIALDKHFSATAGT